MLFAIVKKYLKSILFFKWLELRRRELWSFLHLMVEVGLSRGIARKPKIVFVYGSTADVFLSAAFIDTYISRNGTTIVWCAVQHVEIIEKFQHNHNFKLRILSDKRCRYIQKSWEVIQNIPRQRKYLFGYNPCKGIVMSNVGAHKNLSSLVSQGLYSDGTVHYLDALRVIHSFPDSITPKLPIYTGTDHIKLKEIFNDINQELPKLALITPICYTHSNILKQAWFAISNAIAAEGYNVVFNIGQTAGAPDDGMVYVPEGFPIVQVPAHILPLVGSAVGLVCGRLGGGFFMQQAVLKANRSLLITICHASEVDDRVKDPIKDNERLKDPKPISCIKDLEGFYGNRVDHIAVLRLDDPIDVVFSKVSKALRVVN